MYFTHCLVFVFLFASLPLCLLAYCLSALYLYLYLYLYYFVPICLVAFVPCIPLCLLAYCLLPYFLLYLWRACRPGYPVVSFLRPLSNSLSQSTRLHGRSKGYPYYPSRKYKMSYLKISLQMFKKP